ncbi:hypothetical protein GCM10028813_53490 [Ramlibacter alkalitolerans]
MASSFTTVGPQWSPSPTVHGAARVSRRGCHMTKVRLIRLLAVAVGIAALVAVGVRELRIDRCLDAGGRWNYDRGVCET